MNFYQFINILRSRKSIALAALIMTVITATVISLLLPKQYVATTSVVIDQHSLDPVTGRPLQVQLMPGYMATQVDIISSHKVARKVVDALKLVEDATLKNNFEKSGNPIDIEDWIANLLSESYLEIRPSRDSSLIHIDFTDIDPQFAANAANAFANAYIQTSIELRAQPARLNAEWYDSQMRVLREKLEQSQSVLSTYQQQHGIVVTDDHLDLENARLVELSKQLIEGQARTSELNSRKDLLTATLKQGGSTESLQEVLNNTLIQSLKAESAKAEANFAELSKRLDVNHPQYKQAKAEVNSLQHKIQTEINMVLNSINSGVTASIQHDHIIANAVAEQKNKVLELKKHHDPIAVYQREVENAQRAYDTVMQHAVQSHMESEISQTNISILNPAQRPLKPAKPKVKLNILLSILLGSLLAIGSALVAELMDRRVRSTFDISETVGIPVFAVVSGLPTASR
jgi:polysaccharide biosynthesis transport protein